MQSEVAVIIPVRLTSTRFPRKPFAELNGRKMIEVTFEKAKSFGYDTYIATDAEEIRDLFSEEEVIMTPSTCTDGTDRCMHVIRQMPTYEKYVNVQGDNPNATKRVVDDIIRGLDNHPVVHAFKEINEQDIDKPNICKIIQTEGLVNWFTRSAIPYADQCLGFHGYRKEAAEQWFKLKRFPYEEKETIEHLRWLQNGLHTFGVKTEFNGIEINTPEDLVLWHEKYGNK
jgi:3-deoxy-manno-octulosonate cytidylyltransferase (CMP-KDO synthetase)